MERDRQPDDEDLENLLLDPNAFDLDLDDDSSGQDAVAAALDDIHGDSPPLARWGDCALLVTPDRLRAVLRGPLPEGTSQTKALDWLKEHGITHGVIAARLFDSLPKKRAARGNSASRRRRSQSGGDALQEVVVAEGDPPTPPRAAEISWAVPLAEAETFAVIAAALDGENRKDVAGLESSAPLVRPGQLLARAQVQPGEAGRDVFGESIPPQEPPAARLEAGTGVVLDEGGTCARAEIHGYAGFIGDELRVLEPLWVSPDLMSAYWVALPPEEGAAAPGEDHVREALEEAGIEHGLQEKAVAQLCRNLARQRPVDRLVLLARGTEAEQGSDGPWAFGVSPEETRYAREVERVLSAARKAEYIRSYANGLAAWVVQAGDQLAEKQPPKQGRLGLDVFGEEFMPAEPKAERIEAGDHVTLSADGTTCHAEALGVVLVEDEAVRIIPLLWIDPLCLRACYIHLKQLGPACHPSCESMEALLALHEVSYGVDYEGIAVLCEKIAQQLPVEVVTPIATGDRPRPGRDASFELTVEVGPRPPEFLEDGSVDFRQFGSINLAQEDQRLGVYTPPSEGVSGRDLFQRLLPAQDGRELTVDLGKGVNSSRDSEDRVLYQAAIEGEISFIDRRDRDTPAVFLAVREVLVIRGDVDFHVGDVDYPGNVHVEGDVSAGFTVKAEGDIRVAKAVDNGARLEAEGDILVKQGILGADTKVHAGGSVTARFISDAEVNCGDSVTVSEYFHDARISADEEIVARGRAGNARSGSIIGGTAMAGRCLSVCQAGAVGGNRTQLIAGTRPGDLRQIAHLDRTIAKCEEARRRLLRAFRAENMGAKQLRNVLLTMLSRAQGERKKALAQAIRNFRKVQNTHDQAQQERDDLRAGLRKALGAARIVVTGTVAPNVQVRIGEHTLRVSEAGAEIMDVHFALDRGKGGKSRLRVFPN